MTFEQSIVVECVFKRDSFRGFVHDLRLIYLSQISTIRLSYEKYEFQ